jgi:hypothetical protein
LFKSKPSATLASCRKNPSSNSYTSTTTPDGLSSNVFG